MLTYKLIKDTHFDFLTFKIAQNVSAKKEKYI